MRSLLCATVCAAGLTLGAPACDSGQPKVEAPPKTKSITELKQSSKTEMTPEELEEARRKAGFKDKDELAEENINVMKKGEREYIKTRLADHRELTKTMRGLLDKVEKAAPKWGKAKDPAKAYEGFAEGYKEETKALAEKHNELIKGGGSQIDVQAKLVGVFRVFENLNGDLSPELAGEEGFQTALADIRKQLDEIDGDLEAIEKDESLKVVDTKPEGEDEAKKK